MCGEKYKDHVVDLFVRTLERVFMQTRHFNEILRIVQERGKKQQNKFLRAGDDEIECRDIWTLDFAHNSVLENIPKNGHIEQLERGHTLARENLWQYIHLVHWRRCPR